MGDYLDKIEKLRQAVLCYDYTKTKELLESGINPNSIDDYCGLTALHYAASVGDVECGKLLVRYGANPLRACNDGNTALDLARMHQHTAFSSWITSLDINVITR